MSLGWILLVGYISISMFAVLVLYAACVAAKRADSILHLSLSNRQVGRNANVSYGINGSSKVKETEPVVLPQESKAWRAGI